MLSSESSLMKDEDFKMGKVSLRVLQKICWFKVRRDWDSEVKFWKFMLKSIVFKVGEFICLEVIISIGFNEVILLLDFKGVVMVSSSM